MKEELINIINNLPINVGYGCKIIKVAEQEVFNDLAEIEEKYNNTITTKFFKSDMNENEKFRIKIVKILDVFFYKYIQEYPENQFIRDGILLAFDKVCESLIYQYKDSVDKIELYTIKVDKYFNDKFRKGY